MSRGEHPSRSPSKSVTPQVRAALDRLLAFPVESPFPVLESYEPGWRQAQKLRDAWFDRNLWVMESFVLTFVGDCAALGPTPDSVWLETLHDSMLGYLREWFRAYSRELGAAEAGDATEALSLHRLVAIFQRAYSVDPPDLGYRPATAEELLAATARFA